MAIHHRFLRVPGDPTVPAQSDLLGSPPNVSWSISRKKTNSDRVPVELSDPAQDGVIYGRLMLF
jgi:hypothetical protein